MLSLVVCDCVVVVDHSHAIVQDRTTSDARRTDANAKLALALDRRNGWNGCRHTRSGQWGGVDGDLDVGGTGVDADCVRKVQHN